MPLHPVIKLMLLNDCSARQTVEASWVPSALAGGPAASRTQGPWGRSEQARPLRGAACTALAPGSCSAGVSVARGACPLLGGV